MRLWIPVTVLLSLACAGTPETVQPEPPPPPAPVEPAHGPPLTSYGSAPDRFYRFETGEQVYLGVDKTKVRKFPMADAVVLHEGDLGAKVEVLEFDGDPIMLIDRLNTWVKVRSVGQMPFEGYVFGSLLTPSGGKVWSEEVGVDAYWGVTYSPDHKPRLRVQLPEKVHVLDLTLTKGFTGGLITAKAPGWGDFDLGFDVSQCAASPPKHDGPKCVTGSARFIDGVLTQYTPPDRWRYEPDEVKADPASCSKGTVSVERKPPEPDLHLELPSYMRGPSTEIQCFEIGSISSGRFKGSKVNECASTGGGKGTPLHVIVDRFIVQGSTWNRVMCSSDNQEPEIIDRLVDEKIKVVDHWDFKLEGSFTKPTTLPIDRGTLTLVRHEADETNDFSTDGKALFTHPDVGPAYLGPDEDIAFAQPQGYLRYTWDPGPLEFKSDPSTDAIEWEAETYGCGGEITVGNSYLDDFEPGEALGTASGEPFYAVTAEHPDHAGLVKQIEDWFKYDKDKSKAALETLPFLVIKDPWQRWTLLTRKELRPPNMCEPIVYLYSDPPREVELRFGKELRIDRTWPPGDDGWTGTARPDGRIEVKGQVWDHLFWDGSSVHFPPAEQGWMVRDAAELRERLVELGLQGREIDEALAAWKLPDAPWVRVGVHPRSLIDRIAPLEVSPLPDTTIRVLVEFEGRDDFEKMPPPPVWEGERRGFSLVEWGVVERR